LDWVGWPDAAWGAPPIVGSGLDCQIILPVPYALSLRPGARIVANSAGPSFGQAIVNIDNTTPAWLAYPACYVRAASGSAVRGESGDVKVSAENGPIHPGDLLVSSSTPGHAMKAGPNPAVGTVIGKAMGSLETGSGTLPALIMLQ
jgi:hypothetical protein